MLWHIHILVKCMTAMENGLEKAAGGGGFEQSRVENKIYYSTENNMKTWWNPLEVIGNILQLFHLQVLQHCLLNFFINFPVTAYIVF